MIAYLPGAQIVLGPRWRLPPRVPVHAADGDAELAGAPRRRSFKELGLSQPPSPRDLDRRVKLALMQSTPSELDRAIISASKVGSKNASKVRFCALEGQPENVWAMARCGNRSFCVVIDDNLANEEGYWEGLHAALAFDVGQHLANSLTVEWLQNHYRWVVWKLACQQRCFASVLGTSSFGPAGVVQQLVKRCQSELVQKKRSVLQRIVDTMDVPGVHMVLCVSDLCQQEGLLELTDGWQSVWAKCDAGLARQLRRGRLPVGTKLRIFGAELISERRSTEVGTNCMKAKHSGNAVRPDPSLFLHANGVRRAAWDARLGKTRKRIFRVALSSLLEGGGQAPSVHVRIERCYGPRALLRATDGAETSSTWFTEAGYEAKIRNETVERESHLDNAAWQGIEIEGESECVHRKVSWLLQLVVSDLSGAVGGCDRLCEAAIWLESPEQAAHFEEGSAFRVVGPLLKRSAFGAHSELELEAKLHAWQKLNTAEPLAPTARVRLRACTPLREVETLPPGSEFDAAGVLLAAGFPTPMENGKVLRQLFISDTSGAILGVRCLKGATDPVPRVKIGEPISLRNLVKEHHTRFEAPLGAEHLTRDGVLHVCLSTADCLGFHSAMVMPNGAERAPHMRLALDALVTSLEDPMVHRQFVEHAAVAALLYEAQLKPTKDGEQRAAKCLPWQDDEIRARVEARLRGGGATFEQLQASTSLLPFADNASLIRVLDAMRDDMLCYILPSTGEYRLM